MKLGRKIIGEKTSPYFIAEVGVNHENNLTRAKKLKYDFKKVLAQF